ncbi:MAG: nucleoside-diphosphate sugar epimerase [candidate division Zixibacteria bacterium RBG_16_53_22]|nr:MAG: nucleoside-diphosphate sugar epimerase [candidate division Zixibacteria bacterium RBG_16_53_22]
MKVLITGGAGFIGSHLAEKLLEQGHHVFAVDNLSTGKLENIVHLRGNPEFEFFAGTIMDEILMAEMISQCETIFHLAAAVGVRLIIDKPVDTIETNIMGSEIVLKLANRRKRKVIITSTSEVYGKNEQVPFKESDDSVYGPTVKSRWSYACSKAIDEFLALAYYREKKLPVVIVRLFNTIGARQTGEYGMVVPTFVKQALMGHPLTVFGDGSQSRCFTNVRDVVRAMVSLAENPEAVGQVYNIGSSEVITINDLACRVKELCGSKSEIQYIPYDKAFEAGFEDMYQRVPDLLKIHDAIGYKPMISLDQSIQEIIEYYKR